MLALVSPPDFAPEPKHSAEQLDEQAQKEFDEDPEVQEALQYWFVYDGDTALIDRFKFLRERAFERAKETLEERELDV